MDTLKETATDLLVLFIFQFCYIAMLLGAGNVNNSSVQMHINLTLLVLTVKAIFTLL